VFKEREPDQLLFSLDKLEGEFTSWVHLWTRDFGAGANLVGAIVLNSGTVGAFDIVALTCYRITRDNVLTVYPNRAVIFTTPLYSILRKYIITFDAVAPPFTFYVWRNGEEIFARNALLDNPLIGGLTGLDCSPNGRYIVFVSPNGIGQRRYIDLYEGRP
jgi:hypothetical protein